VRHLNQSNEFCVAFGACRAWIFEPGVESTSMHPEDPTLSSHTELVSMVTDKRVPYSDALAKYAAAFRKISRSSLVRLSSALRRLTSPWSPSRLSACFVDLDRPRKSLSQV
jgi:hypothetical protein